jgi:hypothetical protein
MLQQKSQNRALAPRAILVAVMISVVAILAGGAFYAAVLFGSFALVQRLQPTLREPTSHAAVRP